jgi:hypothetical protein
VPWPARVHAASLSLPPGAERGLKLLYSGEPQAALAIFQEIQAAQPDHPAGYLLEAEAQWWQIYCHACEIKWNMIDAWERPPLDSDDAYLALLEKVTDLAEAKIAEADSAEMRLYAGMGWALRARLLGLRNERRPTARAGVKAREHLLRCIELDPQMTDAYAGLGLYNYYADKLSALAKFLRFFMGIPGGDAEEGLRQLQIAAERGTLARVGAQFYLARVLRVFELDYERSIRIMTPLIAEFPNNPIFQLVLGDTYAKLSRKESARAGLEAAAAIPVSDPACAERIQRVSAEALAALNSEATAR